ncbi:hypothetical protein ACFFJ7_14950 [Pseudochelatococcus lubricantis]|uniref:hypothetical protein n=1 Tax=Pseudochelatococcus lubricantis TaxID=1538102 RepID=UPI0035E4E063
MCDSDVYFFQDGAVNLFSGERYADDRDVTQCISLFRRYFPGGSIIYNAKNIGVALNFDRAERLMFEKFNVECAFFLEDDFLLGCSYLSSLKRIADVCLADGRAGYFSAMGNQYATLEEQRARPALLTPMSHNWAFGLTRAQWLKMRPFVMQYLEIIGESDYRKRDAERVSALFDSWGVGFPGTSQDVVKSIAVHLTGNVKLKTYTCYGRYIGEVGLHSTKAIFEKMGFSNAVFVDDDICSVTQIKDSDFNHARDIGLKYAMEGKNK